MVVDAAAADSDYGPFSIFAWSMQVYNLSSEASMV